MQRCQQLDHPRVYYRRGAQLYTSVRISSLARENGISLNLVVSRLFSMQRGYIFIRVESSSTVLESEIRREEREGDTSHRFNKVAEQRTVYVEGRGKEQAARQFAESVLKIETVLIEKL